MDRGTIDVKMNNKDCSESKDKRFKNSDMNDRVYKRLGLLVRDFEERLDFGQRKLLGGFRLYQEQEQ